MGYIDIDAEEIYNFDKKVLVDIRSPQEFEEFHIPGAVNIPLFENDEKKLIGHIYRTKGVEEAKRVGESIAVEKLEEFYNQFKALKEKYENVIVYCWRGGMRSQGMCEAMSRMGLNLFRLRGGYRAYRQFILKDMERLLEGIRFIVLTGKTGVGKTKLLKALGEEGLPVIDLEGLAKDRGSVFGSVGIREQVSQKMFDALLYEELRKLGDGVIFIEDESRRIGNVYIPEPFWKKKEEGVYVEITASIERRVENILEDYTAMPGWEEEALRAVEKIRKYLGPQKYGTVKELIENKNYRSAVRFLIEEYYDKRYRQFGTPVAEFNCDDLERCVQELKSFYQRVLNEAQVQDTASERGQKAEEVRL